MTHHSPPHTLPGHACMLFQAEDVYVEIGANLGDGLAGPEAVCPGDIYRLDRTAAPVRLVVARNGMRQSVAAGSAIGRPGDAVELVARYTLMGDDGIRVELLLLRVGSGFYALPLSPMAAGIEYTLVQVDQPPQGAALCDLLCISFARGTMITMADGSQRPIETLAEGDRVLTRDHGPQPVRWVGHATLRAVGAFAPVVISAGAFGNTGDLIVSQNHRIFVYLRNRAGGLPTAELLVQAKHLVNGETVFLREGAFLDYFSLVFDRHEIIYAEGIPAESLMVSEATLSRLPAELADAVRSQFPGLSHVQHFGTEAGREALDLIAHLRRPA